MNNFQFIFFQFIFCLLKRLQALSVDCSLYMYINLKEYSSKVRSSFYAPNFGKVEGAYWFGPVGPSVCLSISPSVTLLAAEKLKNCLC